MSTTESKPASILIVNDYDSLRLLEERWAKSGEYKQVMSILFQDLFPLSFNPRRFDAIYLEVQHGGGQAAVKGVSYAYRLREAGYSGGIVLAVNYFPDAVRRVHAEFIDPADIVIGTPLIETQFNRAIKTAYLLSRPRFCF